MIDTPRVETVDAQPTAVIRLVIPRADIRRVMGPAMQEVAEVVAEQGLGPAGPMFSRHFRLDPEVFDFEVGMPVKRPVFNAGRVRASTLPAVQVVRTVYTGPYDGLGEAWGAFVSWIRESGLGVSDEFWESYLTAPAAGAEPATCQTELNRVMTR